MNIGHDKISRYRDQKIEKCQEVDQNADISILLSTHSIETGPSEEMP